jgi:hypothetical protein
MTRLSNIPVRKSEYQLTIRQTLEQEGYTFEEFIDQMLTSHDSIVPACCTEGCRVEPDGRCEHGCPALTLALGVI